MSSGPEKHVENEIKKYLESKGAVVIKIFANEMQGKGWPDLVVCYRGLFIAFECKAPRGVASAIQKATLKRIERAGGITAQPRSLDHVRKILTQIDHDLTQASQLRGIENDLSGG